MEIDFSWCFQINLLQSTIIVQVQNKELICCAALQTEVLFKEIKNDIIDDRYTVRFDESTTSQVKKQLDIYDYYWSKIYDQVVNGYGESCFIDHCTADDF